MAMSEMPRSLTVLGATGSVGRQTLDVVSQLPGRFRIEALVAGRDVGKLAEAARASSARLAVVADASRYGLLRDALAGSGIEVAAGPEAVIEAACRPAELVMAAIVGSAGLESTLAAAERGATIALANKETLVCAGHLVTAACERHGGRILPVDSEHSAIFQVFDQQQASQVERLILTASGGPFRNWTLEEMARATPAQAVAHPNWSMGAKISVDSATMMNKGLEMIEAFHLFPVSADQIEIVVHPQSIVHSMVAYADGSVLAQLGTPDMRTPIAVALGWPERLAIATPRLSFNEIVKMTFEQPDVKRFPSLGLARHVLRAGGVAPTVLNAANEVAVGAFLASRIGFLDIARAVEHTLEGVRGPSPGSIGDVLALDAEARRACDAAIAERRFVA